MTQRIWLVSVVLVAVALSACSGRSSGTGPVCGNGVLEAWEDCDGTDFGEQSCLTAVGVAGGELRCTADCHLDVSGCGQRPECGNGVAEVGEQCDGTDLGGESCESLGYGRGQLGCTGRCVYDVSHCELGPECGNGVLEPGEECDGTDFGEQSCLTAAGLGWGELGCTGDCRLDVSGCRPEPRCGNGVAEEGEACDGEDLGGESCEGLGHDGGELGCTADCELDESRCWDCGDGLCEVEKGEGQQACPADCRWVDLAVGWAHACGMLADGSVWCWGANEHGQLGDGTFQDRWAPVKVVFLGGRGGLPPDLDWGGPLDNPRWGTVAAGWHHTCALVFPEDATSEDATGVRCWGANDWGQLGIGVVGGDYPSPVWAKFGNPWGSDHPSRFRLGAVPYGLVKAWANTTLAFNGHIWLAGANEGCALGVRRPLETTAHFREYGGPGYPFSFNNSLARQFAFASDALCMVYMRYEPRETPYLYCRGVNRGCVFGTQDPIPIDGTTCEAAQDPNTGYYSQYPLGLEESEYVVDLALSEELACVLTSQPRVFCWGRAVQPGYYPGPSSCDRRDMPTPEGETPVRLFVETGQPTTLGDYLGDWLVPQPAICELTDAGHLWCWPNIRVSSTSYMFGCGASTQEFCQMQVPNPVVKAGIGKSYFICVLDDQGRVWCSGFNDRGQLGLGNRTLNATNLPVEVTIP